MPKKKEGRALGRGIDTLLESGRQSDVDPDPASESLSEGKVAAGRSERCPDFGAAQFAGAAAFGALTALASGTAAVAGACAVARALRPRR